MIIAAVSGIPIYVITHSVTCNKSIDINSLWIPNIFGKKLTNNIVYGEYKNIVIIELKAAIAAQNSASPFDK